MLRPQLVWLCWCVRGADTVPDVFWVRFFELQLVGQEGQTPPSRFVSNLVHHILQGVDVLPNVLQREPQTVFTVKADPPQQTNTVGYQHTAVTAATSET